MLLVNQGMEKRKVVYRFDTAPAVRVAFELYLGPEVENILLMFQLVMDSEVETTNLSPNPAFLIGSEYLSFMLIVDCGMFHTGKEMMLERKSIEFSILEKNG